MNWTKLFIEGGAIIAGGLLAIFIYRKLPVRLNKRFYVERWHELQSFCTEKDNWPQAIISADRLLEQALKKSRFAGKTMGERLVAAQRIFSSNDDVWFAHNLVKKVVDNPDLKLKETDVKDALLSFRDALKDLRALPPTKSPASDLPPESK